MEGRGVTNYSGDKPSYAFSTSTTEFDDTLIKRGIVNFEQAMMAKGASVKEAKRLARVKQGEEEAAIEENETESEQDESDDDEFLERYRQQRLQQLKQGSFGEVVPISRPDWVREVNEDSMKVWVVVVLTSHDVERTGSVENAVQVLAPKFSTVKFVTIPSGAAIPNWPEDNLPTIFLYRYGKLQTELIRVKQYISAEELEWKLAEFQVLKTTMKEAPLGNEQGGVRGRGYGPSMFGGTMTQLQTWRYDSDDEDNDKR
jgi:Arc/MetJ-type ribon-helix-helix transcriptional regulator